MLLALRDTARTSGTRELARMSKQLMQVVLPRLARPLYKHLERFQTGKLNEAQFTKRFESLLQRQHQWLSRRGISAARAAIAIHAAVLVLSIPGFARRPATPIYPWKSSSTAPSVKPPWMSPPAIISTSARSPIPSLVWSPNTAIEGRRVVPFTVKTPFVNGAGAPPQFPGRAPVPSWLQW